jgi:hypothetical protein
MASRLSPLMTAQSGEAPLIFSGPIRAIGENNLQLIPPERNHALVEIEQVLAAPSGLGDLRGRVLTVVLAKPAKKNDRHIWCATSWVYERELGVIESARADANSVSAADVVDARLRALDARLVDRLAKAEMVVAGAVAAVEELEPDDSREPRGTTGNDDDVDVEEGKHNDLSKGGGWRRARIRVSTVIKGASAAEVVVQFPAASGPRLGYAPRFVVGQEGVWLLHRRSQEDHRTWSVKSDDAWFSLDPNDAHASSALPRIETLSHLGNLSSRSARPR